MVNKRATLLLTFLLLFVMLSSRSGVITYVSAEDATTETESEDETTDTETEHETDSESEDTTESEEETEPDTEYEPEYERDENGTIWIQTDVMSVKVDTEYPSYQFWYTSDINGSLAKFSVSYRMVVEFEDLNGDGVYQVNETIAFVPLNAFDWILQTGAVTDENGLNEEVYVTYIKGGISSNEFDDSWYEDWMPEIEDDDNDMSLASDDMDTLNIADYKHMTLQFYGHLYMNDYQGTITDDEGVQANYTVSGGVEFKIDIEIGNFPFSSNTSKIAILNYLQEDLASDEDSNHKLVTHEKDGDIEHESEDVEDDYGVRFEDVDENHDGKDDDIQDIALIEGSTNVTTGFYRWVDSAIMRLPNNTAQVVDVGASYWTNGEAMLLFLAYPNFDGGTLMHDPSFELEEAANPTPATTTPFQFLPLELGLVAVSTVAIIGIAALALRKR